MLDVIVIGAGFSGIQADILPNWQGFPSRSSKPVIVSVGKSGVSP